MHYQRVSVIAVWVLFLLAGLAITGGPASTAAAEDAGFVASLAALEGPPDFAVMAAYGTEGAAGGSQAKILALQPDRVVVAEAPPAPSPSVLRPLTVECHTCFTDPGATAFDECSGDLTDRIVVTNPVDINTPGIYTVRYNVSDDSGNAAIEKTREVTVVDTRGPIIALVGRDTVSVLCGQTYKDAGATASDRCAGDVTSAIVTANPVNTAVVGTYTVTYDVSDGNGNDAFQVTRTVNVISSDVTAPEISADVPDKSLAADASCSARVPDLTEEVSATDDVTATADLVITQDPVAGTEIKGLGEHTVTLSVKDAAGNEATDTATLTVTVFDHSASVLTAAAWATNGRVNAMVATEDALYIGGEFTWAGSVGDTGEGWTNLAKIDAATGDVLDWMPVVGGVVSALAVSTDGATLYAGGDGFVDEIEVSTAATVRVTATSGKVSALAVSDDVLYMGGEFTQGTNPNYYLDAYDLTANAFLGWTANVAGPVLSLAVSDTTLYVGEGNGIETVDIAAGGKGEVTLFTVSNGPVNALAVTCETVYAGGGFTSIGGQTNSGVAVLNVSGAAKAAWAPTADSAVRVLALTGKGLYVGGEFTAIDGVALPGIAQFNDGSDPAATVPVSLGALSSEEVKGLGQKYVTFGGKCGASALALPVSDLMCGGADYG